MPSLYVWLTLMSIGFILTHIVLVHQHWIAIRSTPVHYEGLTGYSFYFMERNCQARQTYTLQQRKREINQHSAADEWQRESTETGCRVAGATRAQSSQTDNPIMTVNTWRDHKIVSFSQAPLPLLTVLRVDRSELPLHHNTEQNRKHFGFISTFTLTSVNHLSAAQHICR